MKEKYFLILCLIIAIFSIASVSASENINQAIITDEMSTDISEGALGVSLDEIDNDTLSVSDEEVLTAGNDWYVNGSAAADGVGSQSNPFNNFKAAVQAAENGDTIHIAGGIYSGSENVDLTISTSLNIVNWDDGEVIFDGSDYIGSLFYINTDEINITGITFKNAYYPGPGGALSFYKSLKNSHIKANFINNSAGDSGGAIFFGQSYDGYIENCIFEGDFINNSAASGGAIYLGQNVKNTIFNGNFINNSATSGGAIYFAVESIIEVHGDFINNTATEYGGAFYFSNCYNSNFTANFINNSANLGGAWYSNNYIGNSNIAGEFKYNNATRGGAIYTHDSFSHNQLNANFINNTATEYGGAINFENFNFNNISGSFINNSANNGGAISVYYEWSTNPDSGNNITATFINNSAKTMGGAIYSSLDIVDSIIAGIFLRNNAQSGGAIRFNKSENNKYQANFENNFVNGENALGGAIYIVDNSNKDNFSGVYKNNYATGKESKGGAIYFNKLTNSNISGKFINNSATISSGAGGAIYIKNATNSNFSADFEKNLASQGGAIAFYGDLSKVTFSGDFTGNYANHTGGGIYCNCNPYDLNIFSNFENNSAKYLYGGAIYISGDLINSNITGNYINNTALDWGGAICISSISLNNNITGNFINNTARVGGALWIGISQNSQFYSNFTNNKATGDGGAIFLTDCLNTEIDSNFTNNSASEYGGAIALMWIFETSGLNISGIFENNSASDFGGAIYIFSNDEGVTDAKINAIFLNNRADSAAAILIDAPISKSEINSNFINNTAQYSIIYISEKIKDSSIFNCLFINNTAKSIIDVIGDTENTGINNNIFLNNKKEFDISFGVDDVLNADNNWFGHNDTDYTTGPVMGGKVKYDTWLFLNATANPESLLNLESTSDITFRLLSYNKTSGEKDVYDHSLLEPVNLTVTSTNGYVDKDIIRFGDSVKFTPTSAGTASITASVEDAQDTIELKVYADPELSVSADSINYTENATFRLTYNNTATGKVNITVNGTKFNKIYTNLDINETISFFDPLMAPGEYNVTVTYSGDDIFANDTANTIFTVNKINPPVGLMGHDINVTDINAPLFTLSSSKDLHLDGLSISIIPVDFYYEEKDSVDDEGNLVADFLNMGNPAGEYLLNFTSRNSDYYNDVTWVIISHIFKLNPELSVEDNEIDYGEEVKISLNYNNTATGKVNVTLTGIKSNYTFENIEINETILLQESILPGEYEVSVVYSGDDVFANATASAVLTVNKIDFDIKLEAFDINVTDINETMFLVTVPYGYDGNIDWNQTPAKYEKSRINDTEVYYIYVRNGGNPAGEYFDYINCTGSDIYNDVFINVTSTIFKLDITPQITCDNATFNVTVPEDVTGNMTLNIANKTLEVPVVNGTAVFDLSDIPDGDYKATVTYPGDDIYNGFEKIEPVLIETPQKVIAENLTKYYSGPERLNVTVTDSKGYPKAGQTVEISINGVTYNRTTDENGTAYLNINLNSGEYVAEITVGSESKNVTVTVLPTIKGSDIEKTFMDNTTYDVSVLDSEGNPLEKGTEVSFNIDGVFYSAEVDGMGVAHLNVDLPVGEYVVTATNPVTGESVANNITVNKAASDISMKTFNVSVDNASALIANITLPKYAEGHVIVTIGNESTTADINNKTVDIVGDYAYLPVYNKNLSAGDYNISVTLVDDNYLPSTANGTFTVNKKDITPEITQNGKVLTVDVPDDATGNVTLTVGNETFTSPIVNGTAVFDLSDVPEGVYNATVKYPGDDKYNGFEEISPVNIESDEIIIIAPDLTKYYHGPERFIVNVTTSKGVPIVNQIVQITIHGITYTKITDEKGTASLAITLHSGEFDTLVTVNDTNITAKVTVLPTVNGTDLTKVFKSNDQYYVTVRYSNGTYLEEGSAVEFNIHGMFYTRHVVGNEGLVKLNINLEQGDYIVTATNLVTGEMSSNNITVIPRIIENYDKVLYFRNGTQFTAKIIDDDLQVAGAGIEVTFNIHGVFYTRVTDENGIVNLNINLEPGDYIITSECKGCKVSNNIKVLPVLTSEDISMKYRDGTVYKAKLVDGQGKDFAGQKITTNINGRFYERTTDSNGIITINLDNLPVGEYIPTSSYDVNGAGLSTKITISS